VLRRAIRGDSVDPRAPGRHALVPGDLGNPQPPPEAPALAYRGFPRVRPAVSLPPATTASSLLDGSAGSARSLRREDVAGSYRLPCEDLDQSNNRLRGVSLDPAAAAAYPNNRREKEHLTSWAHMS
jgi:hypothetical protein